MHSAQARYRSPPAKSLMAQPSPMWKKAGDCSDDSEKLFYIALVRQKNDQEKRLNLRKSNTEIAFFSKLLVTLDREKGPPFSENFGISSLERILLLGKSLLTLSSASLL